MSTILAIDPGSYQTGVAVFVDGRLEAYELLSVVGPIENRIMELLTALDQVASRWPDLTQVACEKLTALQGRTPPPELGTLIRRFRQWATAGHRYPSEGRVRQKKHKFAWSEYHPSTVVAAVRPRGLTRRGHKEVLRMGITLLYGAEYGIADADQNIIDSIAVGHCHLSKTVEGEILAGRTI